MRVNTVFSAMDTHNKKYIEEYIKQQIGKLKRLADKNKFDAAFILLPDKYQVNEELRNKQLRFYGIDESEIDPFQPNHLYQQAIKASGYEVLDITPSLISIKNSQGLYYVQDDHFTAMGNKVAAECIYPWLIQILGEKELK